MATKRLGRGLEALIPDIPETKNNDKQKNSIAEVEISSIAPNPFQPRNDFDPTNLEELKQSISSSGLITPITVRRYNNGYQLIAGERRFRAVQSLGYKTVPSYILEVDDNARMLELALVENVQRENLNPVEEALGYQRLIDECKLTQEEVAHKVGKERATVANFLRLLNLKKPILESLRKGDFSAGHARALLSIVDPDEQSALWKKIVKDKISVRQAEKFAKNSVAGKKRKIKKDEKSVSYEIQDTENTLRQILGTQVRIQMKGKGGVLELEFYSQDDLQRLLELIQNVQ